VHYILLLLTLGVYFDIGNAYFLLMTLGVYFDIGNVYFLLLSLGMYKRSLDKQTDI